jgi:hypothetical protein
VLGSAVSPTEFTALLIVCLGGGTLVGGWLAESAAYVLDAADPEQWARLGRVFGGLIGLLVFAVDLGAILASG